MKTRNNIIVFFLILVAMLLSACGNEPDEDTSKSPIFSIGNIENHLAYAIDMAGALSIERMEQLIDLYYIPSFPSIHITSELDPFTQPRTYWHDGTVTLSGAALGFNFEYADARFRGRGNSTWWRGRDKRPLRVRLRPARPVMSDYEARDWILLANQFDRSLLRNYTVLNLGLSLSGLGFTPIPHHVHLYVNGEYMGVYLLTDERDVGPGRMQLQWNDDPAKSDFFLELDARAPVTGILDETYVMVNGLPYDLRWPGDLTPQHVDYVRNYLTAVSHAIRTQSFDDILALIDLDSFVDFYIIQEFSKDVDARDLSIFMYIAGTGDERRLFKGPIWDFDLTMGNASYQPMGYGPEGLYVAVFNYWYRYLMGRPEFFDAVKTRWNEIRHREIAQAIQQTQATAIRYRHEFERNFTRHPYLLRGRQQMPTPQDILEIESFLGNVGHLLNWLEARANWLDNFFNGKLPDYDHMWALVEYQYSTTPITITVNGVIHETIIPPIRMHNRILIALQDLEAIFGFEAEYDAVPTGMIAIQHGDIYITHQIGDLHVNINGVKLDFPMPTALIIRDYVFVPFRAFIEALGYELDWSNSTRTSNIEI